MDPTAVLDFINKGGVLAVLILLLFVIGLGGFRRWFVFGWLYREKTEEIAELKKDRDRWQESALAALGAAHRTTQVIERVAETPTPLVSQIVSELEARLKAGGTT